MRLRCPNWTSFQHDDYIVDLLAQDAGLHTLLHLDRRQPLKAFDTALELLSARGVMEIRGGPYVTEVMKATRRG